MPTVIIEGDTVVVTNNLATLKAGQESHGGWADSMQTVCGMSGVVKKIKTGTAQILFTNGQTWWINGQMISKVNVNKLKKGNKVRISANVSQVQQLQKGHGGFLPDMMVILGKVATIRSIDSDGDVEVAVPGQKNWILNPMCCTKEGDGDNDTADSDDDGAVGGDDSDDDDLATALQKLLLVGILQGLTEAASPTKVADDPASLLQAAGRGDVRVVKKLLSQHPEWVNFKTEDTGYSALHIACHEGNMEVVQLLLKTGAKLEDKDKDGDSAILFALQGHKPEVVKYLLSKYRINTSIPNKAGMVPLHVSVWKEDVECTKLLLKSKCDFNLQDNDGDTALHMAIMKKNDTLINLLLSQKKLDVMIINRKGFNVLHKAALIGQEHAVMKLVQLNNSALVHSKKGDGFTALHVAAFNDHVTIMKLLIEKGHAKVDALTLAQQTPLMLAAEQKHSDSVEYLISKHASVKLQDIKGDTALHRALTKKKKVPTATLR